MYTALDLHSYSTGFILQHLVTILTLILSPLIHTFY